MSQASLKEIVVRGVLWSTMDNWGRQVLAFTIYAVLARLVGPESFGLVALGGVYVGFIDILVSQGFGTALVQRKDLDDRHLDSAFWLSLGVGAMLTLVSVVLAEQVAGLFSEPRLTDVLRWLSGSLLLLGLSAVPQAVLVRAMSFRALTIRSLLATVTGGVVGLAMAWHGFGVWSLVGQQLSGATVGTIALWWATDWRPSLHLSGRHLRDLYGFSLSIVANELLWCGSQRADQTLIGYSFGPAALGPYALASRCVQLLMDSVAAPLQLVALPAFSRLQDERERLQHAFYKSTEIVATLAAPVFLGLAALAPSLVPVMFGPQWSPAVVLLQGLAIYGLLRVTLSFGHPLILSVGRAGIYFLMFVLLTVLTVGLCLLATRWNPLAVAAAMSVALVLQSMVFLAVCRRFTGISLIVLASRLWVPTLMASVMFGVVAAFREWAHSSLGDLLTIAIGVPLGAAVYSVGVFIFKPGVIKELLRIVVTRLGARPTSTEPAHRIA
jgi:PST family polysaccharide transporter